MDELDLGINRKPGYSADKAQKADLLDTFIALISIFTYIADIGTDVFVATQYFKEEQWNWFIPTIVFIIVPSVSLQLFSTKWYIDDAEHGKQSWFSKLLHFVQLGAIERYWYAFWYGSKTLCLSEIQASDYAFYLWNWRDVTMLRFFECFFESAPQVTLQLYYLSTLDRKVTVQEDWAVLLTVVVSVVSIAWSMVSYSHAFRLCYKGKGYGLLGYICQILYRLFMIASRIAALVLFMTEYSWIVIILCFVHWMLMVVWLSVDGSEFCSSTNKIVEWILEKLFLTSIGFVYIFCFINIKEGTTRPRVMAYYILFFVENSLMIAIWYLRRPSFGILEIGSICLIWVGFLLGIVFMLLHYKFFHPNEDITEGWFTCSNCCRPSENDDTVSDEPNCYSLNQHHNSQCGDNSVKTTLKTPPQLHALLSVDVELSPQRERFSNKNMNSNRQASDIKDHTHNRNLPNLMTYGAIDLTSISRRERRNSSELSATVVPGSSGSESLTYRISSQKSEPYDMNGTVTAMYV